MKQQYPKVSVVTVTYISSAYVYTTTIGGNAEGYIS